MIIIVMIIIIIVIIMSPSVRELSQDVLRVIAMAICQLP